MRIVSLSLLIWLVATATVVWLAWLAFPRDVSLEIFWLRLVFLIWLVTANKIPSLLVIWIARKSSTSRYAAVLPSLHVVTFIYSVVAGLALLANVYKIPLLAETSWHWGVQLVLAAVMTLTALFIALAVEAGVEGHTPAPMGAVEPEGLAKVLTRIEASPPALADSNLASAVKALKERIRYSFPPRNDCFRSTDYVELSKGILSLEEGDPPDVQKVQVVIASCSVLASRVVNLRKST